MNIDRIDPGSALGEAIRLRRPRSFPETALLELVAHKAAEFVALDPRERAAVAWAEAVISSGKQHVADEAYAALHAYFDDDAIAKFTAVAGTVHLRARLRKAG